MLPDLSCLTVGANLFDHLAKNGVGKDECSRHKEPVLTAEDGRDNCAVDGYLMFKTLAAKEADPRGVSRLLGRRIATYSAEFEPLLTRSFTAYERLEFLKTEHSDWISRVFPIVCDRGGDLGPVKFANYGPELASVTDWFVLDAQGEKGHLFVSLANNKTMKNALHIPNKGLFSGRFLFIALVCSNAPGFGKKMLSAAEELAALLGCDGIALASLSNSAGAYFNAGYQFVSKRDGSVVDVSPWVESQTRDDGTTRLFLKQETDLAPARGKRRAAPEPEPEPAPDSDESSDSDCDGPSADERSCIRRKLEETLERARQLYRRWSLLSMGTPR